MPLQASRPGLLASRQTHFTGVRCVRPSVRPISTSASAEGSAQASVSSIDRPRIAIPSSPDQQVQQAVASIEAGWKAGIKMQRLELLLPLIGATDLDDWPGERERAPCCGAARHTQRHRCAAREAGPDWNHGTRVKFKREALTAMPALPLASALGTGKVPCAGRNLQTHASMHLGGVDGDGDGDVRRVYACVRAPHQVASVSSSRPRSRWWRRSCARSRPRRGWRGRWAQPSGTRATRWARGRARQCPACSSQQVRAAAAGCCGSSSASKCVRLLQVQFPSRRTLPAPQPRAAPACLGLCRAPAPQAVRMAAYCGRERM